MKPPFLPNKFAIYTGNAYPHKNLHRLVSTWPKVYQQTKVKLVISSGRSAFSRRIEEMVNESVIYKGYLTDSELKLAYSKALAYVFPTLAEGFGIPGLDAMNFSLPVVCSDIPVLHEVYGPAAYYFNPQDPKDMAKKIIAVLTDQKLRQHLIRLGKIQVKKYSWAKTAALTLKAYESCFSL